MGLLRFDLGLHCCFRCYLGTSLLDHDSKFSLRFVPSAVANLKRKSEIFPISIRSKGASISASSNWLNNFAVAFFVPPMLEAIEWGTYIFFAGFLAAGIVWVWIYLPETKNTTMEDMDRVFNSTTGEEDRELLEAAKRDVGLLAFLETIGPNAEKIAPADISAKNDNQHVEKM